MAPADTLCVLVGARCRRAVAAPASGRLQIERRSVMTARLHWSCSIHSACATAHGEQAPNHGTADAVVDYDDVVGWRRIAVLFDSAGQAPA